MKRTLVSMLLLGLLGVAHPAPASAQRGLSVAVNGGTLGIGVDVAMGLSNRIALKSGAAVSGLDLTTTGLFSLESDVTGKLRIPKGSFKIGADFLLGGGPRLGAGLMVWANDPVHEVTLEPGGSVDIGGTDYRQVDVTQVLFSLKPNTRTPYAVLGFGSPAGSGMALLLDLGVVFLGNTSIDVSAMGSDQIVGSPEFLSHLEAETRATEQDLGWKLNYWPIVTLGLRYGF